MAVCARAVERGRDGANASAAGTRSAGAKSANRSAPSAGLPEIHAAGSGATGPARQFHAAGVRRRHHRLRLHQFPQEGETQSRRVRGQSARDHVRCKRRIARCERAAGRRFRRPIRAAIAPGVAMPLTISPYQTPRPPPAPSRRRPAAPPVEIGPIRKLPPKRKAHTEPDDPYAPLGVHAGAFTLFPAIELIGGYDTNPSRANGGSTAASLYTVAPELQVQSNWSRHELKADLRGSYTGYSPDTTPTLSRPNFNGKVDGRVDVTKDTRIDLGTRLLVSTDNPGSPNMRPMSPSCRSSPPIGGSAGLGQSFNRFDLPVKADAERTIYQNSTLTDGTIASNDDRNYNQIRRHAARQLRIVARRDAIRRAYRRHPRARSQCRFFRLSAQFQRALPAPRHDLRIGDAGSPAMSASAIRGAPTQTRASMRIGGLIGNASLIWTADALTTVKFTAASTVGEFDDSRRVWHSLSRRRPAGRSLPAALADRHGQVGLRGRRL